MHDEAMKEPAAPRKAVRKYAPPLAISLSDAEIGFGGSCSLGS
jgi:hypothetical protein